MRRELTQRSEIEALIASPTPTWLFKHSRTCGISSVASDEVDRYLEEHGEDQLGMVVVQSQRPLSTWIATRLAYTHQSPQLFLLHSGAVRWHASHYGITAEAMAAARQELAKRTP